MVSVARDGSEHWTHSADLDNMLQASLKMCGDVDLDPLTDQLSASVVLEDHAASAAEYSITATDCIQLGYSVDWPLSALLTSETIHNYSRVFSFLLKIKHVSYVLRDIWIHFQTLGGKTRSNESRVRQLQILRLEIQHFVSMMLNSVTSQVLEVTLHSYTVANEACVQFAWQEFQEQLASVDTIEKLVEVHRVYLQSCINRCLLSKSPALGFRVDSHEIHARQMNIQRQFEISSSPSFPSFSS